MLKSDAQRGVASFFMENLAVKLMETQLNVLGSIRRGEMVTERVAALSLNYLILWYVFLARSEFLNFVLFLIKITSLKNWQLINSY